VAWWRAVVRSVVSTAESLKPSAKPGDPSRFIPESATEEFLSRRSCAARKGKKGKLGSRHLALFLPFADTKRGLD
jgi:hypothetical protein